MSHLGAAGFRREFTGQQRDRAWRRLDLLERGAPTPGPEVSR